MYEGDKLAEVLRQGEDELGALDASVHGRIVRRRRPKATGSTRTCTMFIDECGSHSLKSKEKFESFCVAAVIVDDEALLELDRRWKRWKRDYLGSASKPVHETDIRAGRSSFWCDGSTSRRARAIKAIDRIVERLDFSAVACVLHRPSYVAQWGNSPPDQSLPTHPYLMMMDFLAERLAMALYERFDEARGRVVIESRGPLEDANVQHEFARLFLDGTSYVSATWFRQQFLPGIAFLDKDENSTGLQLADLLARACAEKVMAPDRTPARWKSFSTKLCPGVQTAHSIIGFKVVPWDERYSEIWKS